MAATKKRSGARKPGRTADEGFTVVLEEIRGQFAVFGEALEGLRERVDAGFEAVDKRFEAVDKRFEAVERRFQGVDRRFEAVEGQLALLVDATRTHSKALQRIEGKLENHESRISKLEGAAE